MQKNISKPQKRKPNPHHNQHLETPHKVINHRKNNNVVLVAVIIIGLLGAGITFFIMGASLLWLIVGFIVGGVIGFYFGTQIVKGLSKTK